MLTAADTEIAKALVRRLVDEVVNAGDLSVLDEIYTRAMARAAAQWIEPFREAFPDFRMEIVQLVAEDFRDGRLARAWGREDTLTRIRQLGLPD